MKAYGKRIVTARMGQKKHLEMRIDLKNSIKDAIIEADEAQKNKYSLPREWMNNLMSPFLRGIGIIAAILATLCIVKSICAMLPLTEFHVISFIKFAVLFLLGLFLASVSLTSFWTEKDLQDENDRQFVASMFSNITSLTALLIAALALLKDVIW